MSDSQPMNHLGIRALNDLTNRAKPGIFIYAVVWMCLVYSLDLYKDHFVFFALNSIALLVLVSARSLHLLYRKRVSDANVTKLHNFLVGAILIGAMHWGLMSAWVFMNEDMSYATNPVLIILAGFAMGGTATLSISRAIRIYYPMLLYTPTIILFLSAGTNEGYLYGVLISISWIYIYVSSASTQSDYWQAVSNHLIAEARAEEMEKLSITDPLTQLKNRMYFDAEFSKEWQRSARIQSCLSILMVDLDYFKHLNDNYGHLFGDECLREVSACLLGQVMRPADVVSRYGGEEFIIMLPNTNEEGATTLAERVVRAVSELHFEHEGKVIKVTCSVGVATDYPKNNGDSSELVKRADAALYEAKEQGRNRYVVDTSEMSTNPGLSDLAPQG